MFNWGCAGYETLKYWVRRGASQSVVSTLAAAASPGTWDTGTGQAPPGTCGVSAPEPGPGICFSKPSACFESGSKSKNPPPPPTSLPHPPRPRVLPDRQLGPLRRTAQASSRPATHGPVPTTGGAPGSLLQLPPLGAVPLTPVCECYQPRVAHGVAVKNGRCPRSTGHDGSARPEEEAL